MSDADDARKKAIEESGLDPELFVNKLMTCAYARKGLDYEERKKQGGQLTRKELVEFCIPLLAEMFGTTFAPYKPKEEEDK